MKLLLYSIVLTPLFAIPAAAQQLRPSALAAAGNASVSNDQTAKLQFTIGETAIATLSVAGASCGQGFHNSAVALSVDASGFDLADWGLKVYPNPASSSVSVEYASDKPGAALELSLWNLDGRRLTDPVSLQNGAVQRIETNQLTNGLYLLRIAAPDGRSGSVRLVKAD